MKFYADLNGHSEPTIWHNPDMFPYVPVPIVSKHQVPPGYWDEIVYRLVGGCTICPRVAQGRLRGMVSTTLPSDTKGQS